MRGGLALAAIMMCGAPASGEHWPDSDWQVLDTKVRWALAQGLDTVPLGSATCMNPPGPALKVTPAGCARQNGWKDSLTATVELVPCAAS